jgi:hypothetical protein
VEERTVAVVDRRERPGDDRDSLARSHWSGVDAPATYMGWSGSGPATRGSRVVTSAGTDHGTPAGIY